MDDIMVSIIVPVYKQAQYLEETLQSVLNQSFTNWECIIVSDGSPDNTEEVAGKWTIKDNRFKYFYQQNAGVSSARNLGIRNASGKYILPLDADDLIATEYVALAMDAFDKNETLKLVYCKAEKFGDETGTLRLIPYSLYDLCDYNMIFCTAFYQKKDWELIGGYDEKMLEGLEDWEFWIALLKNGGAVKCLDYTGFHYRFKKVSRSKAIQTAQKESLNRYIKQKHSDFFLASFDTINKYRMDMEYKLASEKFIINLFTKKILGFTIFSRPQINLPLKISGK